MTEGVSLCVKDTVSAAQNNHKFKETTIMPTMIAGHHGRVRANDLFAATLILYTHGQPIWPGIRREQRQIAACLSKF